MNTILADIGGTNVRFALAGEQGIVNPQKLKSAAFDGFLEAMEHYCDGQGVKADAVIPATAAWPDAEGIYKFSNETGWDFDPEKIRKAGYEIKRIYNDFEAASYGALSPKIEKLTELKPGRHGREYPRLVCGPGTGLGLGFALPEGEIYWRVQPTFGARMIAAGHTEEQHQIIQAVLRVLGPDKIVEFEHLASGRGMILLHQAVCDIYGFEQYGERAEHILEKPKEESAQITLRLFHEFLGLFVHSAVMFTHSYGGVYMTGGMMDRLMERDLFDAETLVKFMTIPLAEYIDHVMKGTALYHASDPYLALKGLSEVHAYGR